MSSLVHHTRAHEVLQALDAARKQRDQNDNLRNVLLDSEDLLSQMTDQLFSQKMFRDIAKAHSSTSIALFNFEEKLSFSATTKRHDASRYINDCQLVVPLSELTNEDSIGSLRAVSYATNALMETRASALAANLVDHFFQHALHLLQNASALVDSTNLDSDPWLPVVEPAIELLRQLLDAPPVHQPLVPLVQEISNLFSINDSLKHKIETMTQAGDLAAAESAMNQRVTLCEALSDLITHKFYLLDEEEKNKVGVFLQRAEEVETQSKKSVTDLRVKAARRRRLLEEDLARLNEERSKAQADEDAARASFLAEKESSDKELQNNWDAQTKVWEQLFELEKQLADLAAKRRIEVDRRVKMTEREERRRVDMRHFEEFVNEHQKLLEATIRTCQADDQLGDIMEDVVTGTCVTIKRRSNDLYKDLSALRNAAYEEHLHHFTEQYLFLGEIMFRKNRLLDELRRKAEYAVAQQEMAMDSFNPSARKYAQMKAELDAEADQLAREVEQLKDKATVYYESFKPTEKALSHLGKTFVHPQDALEQAEKEKGRKIAAFHSLMIEGPPGKIDTSKVSIEEEQRQIVQDRERLSTCLKNAEARSKPKVIETLLPEVSTAAEE